MGVKKAIHVRVKKKTSLHYSTLHFLISESQINRSSYCLCVSVPEYSKYYQSEDILVCSNNFKGLSEGGDVALRRKVRIKGLVGMIRVIVTGWITQYAYECPQKYKGMFVCVFVKIPSMTLWWLHS